MEGPRYYETYNPAYAPAGRFAPRRRFGTSLTELAHLAVAIAVLTTAIVLWMQHLKEGTLGELPLISQIFIALGVAVTGFALHEIAHKITAQHFGHWSEFRASVPGLILTVVMSAAGFLFGAPGATWHTATSPRDNGKISAAGPLLNLVLATAAWPFTSGVTDSTELPHLVADGVLLFNTILAAFNLLPFGPLDGKKVLRWNPIVYAVLVILTVLLLINADIGTIIGL